MREPKVILLASVAAILWTAPLLQAAAQSASPPAVPQAASMQCGGPRGGVAPKYAKDDKSPEARLYWRYPQKARVGHLVGLPMLDGDDKTLGDVQKVVRTPEGRVELIVSYSKWFGWFGRPVAVPIEDVAILALQIDSLDMQPKDYAKAPTWTQGKDQTLPDDETVCIGIGRR